MVTKEYMKAYAEKYYANEENRKRHNEWQRRYNRRPENRKRRNFMKAQRLTTKRYNDSKNSLNVVSFNDETLVVTKKCNICGKIFERDCKLKHGWRKDQCSDYCYLRNRDIRFNKIILPIKRSGKKLFVMSKCQYKPCGKIFKAILSQHKGHRKYCSDRCSKLNQRVIRKQHDAIRKHKT